MGKYFQHSMTKVVNIRNAPYDIYIGRPSTWGNPYVIGFDGTRSEVIEKYRTYIQPRVAEIREQLCGKVLGCWCKPLDCHGDVLVEIADSDPDAEIWRHY